MQTGPRQEDRSSVELVEVATGQKLRSLTGHRNKIAAVAFTPDGKALITGSEDCTALVWDVSDLLPREKPAGAKSLWEDMKSDDRLRAYSAFCQLRASPSETLALLKTQLKGAVPADAALERQRLLWAIGLLEELNTVAARELLQTLASGNAGAAGEAQAARKRMQRASGQGK